MNGQLILTSNGIDSEPIINYLKSSLECSFSSVGMLTTASVGYKEKDFHIPALIKVFELLGLTVSFIDIEYDNPINILEYDLLYILGGNPFHLLKQLREKKCKPIFEKFLSEGKIIIGASA